MVENTTSASRLWLARRMVEVLARALPDRITWTTRLRRDAAPFELAPTAAGKPGYVA